MKITSFLLLIAISLSNCINRKPQANIFFSSDDTLIIESVKIEGNGLFMVGAGELNFRDTTEWTESFDWFNFQFTYPENLQNVKIGLTSIAFNPLRYFDNANQDTIQLNTSRQENIIGIARGNIGKDEVFILDENNNRDFRDDSVRKFIQFDWNNDENLIKCKYSIERKDGFNADSGWIKIGHWRGIILKHTSQHFESSFSIDNTNYIIGIADDNSSSFCFFRPVFAILSENYVRRDTLMARDLLRPGEFFRLGKSFYEINDFYSGSGTLKLVRIDDFESIVGIQIGANAPSFEFISVSGDTIRSQSYENHELLIANVSVCSPRSFDELNKINAVLDNDLKVFGINSGVNKDLNGIIVDVENEFNEDLYFNFRNAYSSYDCFLIGSDGRIKDKFSIFDWESHLKEYMK